MVDLIIFFKKKSVFTSIKSFIWGKLFLLSFIVCFFFVSVSMAQSMYVSSTVGANLRNGTGTEHSVVSTVGYNEQVRVVSNEGSWKRVEYRGKTGYISSSLLSENQGRTSQNNSSNYGRGSTISRTSGNSKGGVAGASGYTTAIGLRGGFTSGVSLKHFTSSRGALELVVGSRWHGVSLSGMYQMHQSGALGVPELSWVYGLGAKGRSLR